MEVKKLIPLTQRPSLSNEDKIFLGHKLNKGSIMFKERPPIIKNVITNLKHEKDILRGNPAFISKKSSVCNSIVNIKFQNHPFSSKNSV